MDYREWDIIAQSIELGEKTDYTRISSKLYGFGKDLNAIDKLKDLRRQGNIYITLDKMAFSRIKGDLREYITNNYSDVFQSEDVAEQKIYVYKLSKE